MLDGVVVTSAARGGRRRWSKAEKFRIVAETREPGVRIGEVADRHAIEPFAWLAASGPTRFAVRGRCGGVRVGSYAGAVGIDKTAAVIAIPSSGCMNSCPGTSTVFANGWISERRLEAGMDNRPGRRLRCYGM